MNTECESSHCSAFMDPDFRQDDDGLRSCLSAVCGAEAGTMKKTVLAAAALVTAAAPPPPPPGPDATLRVPRAASAEVSEARLHATVAKLVSFGTRHTLS